jgi:hypothetical protein
MRGIVSPSPTRERLAPSLREHYVNAERLVEKGEDPSGSP